MKRLLFVSLLAVSAAASGLVASSAPAPAAPQPATLTVAGLGWSIPLTPKTVPPHKRTIEVVDRAGSAWAVPDAVAFLDRYTASRMKVVRKCSGRAYRCVTVKLGKVNGPVGWSSGSTITIDADKAMTWYRSYYYRVGNRLWLVAHELGHQFGLGHRSSHNLMNPDVRQKSMVLTTGQRRHLAKR